MLNINKNVVVGTAIGSVAFGALLLSGKGAKKVKKLFTNGKQTLANKASDVVDEFKNDDDFFEVHEEKTNKEEK